MTEEAEFTWEQIKPLYGEIFDQLVKMPSFTEWFATHCDIDIHIDDAEERIMVQVKSLSMQETAKRILALEKAKAEDGPLIVAPNSELVI